MYITACNVEDIVFKTPEKKSNYKLLNESPSLEHIGIKYNLSNKKPAPEIQIHDFNKLYTELHEYDKEHKKFDNNIIQDINEIYEQIAKCIGFISINTDLQIKNNSVSKINDNAAYIASLKPNDITDIKEQLNAIMKNIDKIQYLKKHISTINLLIESPSITIRTIDGLFDLYQTIICNILNDNNEKYMNIHWEIQLLIENNHTLFSHIQKLTNHNEILSSQIQESTNDNKKLSSQIKKEQIKNKTKNIAIWILSICILFSLGYIAADNKQNEFKCDYIVN